MLAAYVTQGARAGGSGQRARSLGRAEGSAHATQGEHGDEVRVLAREEEAW